MLVVYGGPGIPPSIFIRHTLHLEGLEDSGADFGLSALFVKPGSDSRLLVLEQISHGDFEGLGQPGIQSGRRLRDFLVTAELPLPPSGHNLHPNSSFPF